MREILAGTRRSEVYKRFPIRSGFHRINPDPEFESDVFEGEEERKGGYIYIYISIIFSSSFRRNFVHFSIERSKASDTRA